MASELSAKLPSSSQVVIEDIQELSTNSMETLFILKVNKCSYFLIELLFITKTQSATFGSLGRSSPTPHLPPCFYLDFFAGTRMS